MSNRDLSLVNIEVVSLVRNGVSLVATKSNLVTVYVSPSSVPGRAYDGSSRLCDFLILEEIPHSAPCDDAPVRVQLGLSKHHLKLWAGLQRGPTCKDCAKRAGRHASDPPCFRYLRSALLHA